MKDVQTIGAYAFYNCTSLKSIELGDGLDELRQHVFDGCENLQSIVIPQSVGNILDYAFNNCSMISDISITGNVYKVGDSAFVGCASLENFTVEHNDEILYASYTNYPTKYPEQFIWGTQYNENIKSLTLNRNVRGSLNFKGVEKLFVGKAEELYSVDLSKCDNLHYIYASSKNPCRYTPSFSTNQYMSVTVYVPTDALETYKAHTSWGEFWNIEPYDFPESIVDLVINDTETIVMPQYFRVDGTRLMEEPSNGLYIKKVGCNISKIIK